MLDWREIDTMMLSGRSGRAALEPFSGHGVAIVTTDADADPSELPWSGPGRGAQ